MAICNIFHCTGNSRLPMKPWLFLLSGGKLTVNSFTRRVKHRQFFDWSQVEWNSFALQAWYISTKHFLWREHFAISLQFCKIRCFFNTNYDFEIFVSLLILRSLNIVHHYTILYYLLLQLIMKPHQILHCKHNYNACYE